ncbi:3782_t:CDS:2 [Entrophospora sp. SA101]|nr:3782_t:CDS:2 [Entrophospora sp. SA101]
MSLVADYSSDVYSSGEEEEKTTTTNKNELSSLIPPPKKKKDGPVKIVIDLPSFTKDEESEDEKKTIKNNGRGGSDLLSLLPAPKNLIKDKASNKSNLASVKLNVSSTIENSNILKTDSSTTTFSPSSHLNPKSLSNEFLSNEHYSYNNWEGSSTSTYTNNQIQKLGGRRGKEGPIKIKEINAADQMADAWQTQMADITKPSKGTGSGHSNLKPSKVQKRKHNLMYLAYQATSMENDLKEQFATNKKTKRETQAKYATHFDL